MAYIGNSPFVSGNFSSTTHSGTGSSLGPFAIGQSPGTKNAVLVFIDGVRQVPTIYNVSGSDVTFTAGNAPPLGTDNVQILVSGEELSINVPADDSIAVDALNTTSAGTTGQFLQKSSSTDIDWATVDALPSQTSQSGKFLTTDGSSASWGTVDTTNIEDDIALLGFKVASTGSLSKYNLVDQTEDAFHDNTGVDAGDSTNATWNAAKYFSGEVPVSVTASGGTETTYGIYTIHSFLSGTSNFITDTAQDIDILVVAGGGGGGTGGGGAGGMIASPAFSVSAGTHSVTVGGGGTAGGTASKGGNGDDSTFPTLTAIGGGGGGKNDSHYPDAQGAQVGGSGGGMGASSNTAKSQGAPGTAGQGNAGANTGSWASPYPANGGGGAGTTGFSGGGSTDGNGGTGLENDYRTNVNVFYAGGGAGSYAGGGTGGSGGGGNSSANGATNTGGGGGGQAAGGSGIVVLRRPTSATAIGNMTLVSEFTEAEATPTKGDIVMTYTNGVGTTSVNTDLKAYASRDDGTTWTLLTLGEQGSTGSHYIVSAHNVDISSQPTDKTMRYKIETLNQSATKETRIQAVSLGWS